MDSWIYTAKTSTCLSAFKLDLKAKTSHYNESQLRHPLAPPHPTLRNSSFPYAALEATHEITFLHTIREKASLSPSAPTHSFREMKTGKSEGAGDKASRFPAPLAAPKRRTCALRTGSSIRDVNLAEKFERILQETRQRGRAYLAETRVTRDVNPNNRSWGTNETGRHRERVVHRR